MPEACDAVVLAAFFAVVAEEEAFLAAVLAGVFLATGFLVAVFFTGRVLGVDDPVRLLAVPEPATEPALFVVVGATLGDRNEALGRLFVL